MTIECVQKAARHFLASNNPSIESLGNGLIHHTYRVTDALSGKAIVLQAINTHIFKKPEDIVYNYLLVYNFLEAQGHSNIAAPVPADTRNLLWIDEGKNAWRATEFVPDSYSPMTATNNTDAFTVSRIFGEFTRSLANADVHHVRDIIPGFHDLAWRYRQFEEAVYKAPLDRLLKSTHSIAEFRQRKFFVDYFDFIQHDPAYPSRIMHHDCKISNILFHRTTNKVICPVDLDTVMPGKFFSDLGDMIRSMACTVDENSIEWEKIEINPDFYQSILQGYLEGVGEIFTPKEKEEIHWAGLLMTYMQGLRFLADFLNGDTYYKTTYPEQNLNRALNQLILLEKLEEFLRQAFHFNLTFPKNT